MNLYHCENCTFEAPYKTFVPARDLLARMTPGDIYTDVECPRCGALAHETKLRRTYTIMAQQDGNDTFEVQADSDEGAYAAALSELGWSVGEPHAEDDD